MAHKLHDRTKSFLQSPFTSSGQWNQLVDGDVSPQRAYIYRRNPHLLRLRIVWTVYCIYLKEKYIRVWDQKHGKSFLSLCRQVLCVSYHFKTVIWFLLLGIVSGWSSNIFRQVVKLASWRYMIKVLPSPWGVRGVKLREMFESSLFSFLSFLRAEPVFSSRCLYLPQRSMKYPTSVLPSKVAVTLALYKQWIMWLSKLVAPTDRTYPQTLSVHTEKVALHVTVPKFLYTGDENNIVFTF